MPIRSYVRLLLWASVGLVPLLLLLITWVDAPLARLVHEAGAPGRAFWLLVMLPSEWVQEHIFYRGLPLGWLALLTLFLLTWARRLPSGTVWLVTLGTLIGSEALAIIAKLFFNRPRPLDVFTQAAPAATFWSPLGRFDAFPSGHVAWVAGLLLPLALQFPRLRPWLLAYVGLVALGRVGLEAHWLSDVVAAGYLALVLTCLLEIGTGWLRPRGTRLPVPAAPPAA